LEKGELTEEGAAGSDFVRETEKGPRGKKKRGTEQGRQVRGDKARSKRVG